MSSPTSRRHPGPPPLRAVRTEPTPSTTVASLPSTVPTSKNSRTALLPPATPIPQHPDAVRPEATGLSTAATTFALKAYLETYLMTLGWDPTDMSASAFITQYSWLLGEELGLPPLQAAAIFDEIFEATTPTMGRVCLAIIGMQEKLGCSAQCAKAVRRLFTKNHDGKSPEWALANWDEGVLEGKCGVEIMGRVGARKRVGGWWAVVRVAARRMCGGKKWDGEESEVDEKR